MAEMVGSAVAEETVKQVFAGLIGRQVGRPADEKEQHMERLEMAKIKLEAVLETSRQWHIKGASSLLRWRKKLKRAARECDDVLRECKKRAIDDEVREQEVKSSSFPRRLAHATKSLVKAFFNRDDNHDVLSSYAVERFERLADGASEFLRFVELGGTPRRYMMLHPLIGRLLAGQELRYRLVRRSKYHLFCVRPVRFEDRGMEAKLLFVYEDDEAPEKNLCLGSKLRLSESMDVVGTIIKCLEMFFTPQFKPTAESARKEISQLPTQDFLWVPYVEASHKEHWNTIHSNMTRWFRPNPMCCKQKRPSYSSSSTVKQSSDLEPVIEVSLQGHIPLSDEYNMDRSKAVEGESSCLKNSPHLKLGLLFSPHGSSEDLDPQVESSAIVVINGTEQSGVRTNVSLEELDELMLPKAIDCLHRKADTTAYQIFWKSKHGTAFLLVEKTCLTKMPPRCISSVGDRRWAIQRRRDPKLERWIRLIKDFLNLWVPHAPPRLQRSFIEWIQKANEMQLAGLTN
ncbi:hypothetical protein SEVIR_3G351500v4 [Setaria viridis]|uniref:Rx N-terminal domain-containing protein n=1 Tax=Setaria viridis TaxID=4556 RepID=A0A4U6VVB1_SETVI|nr:uncharacterized protein LOC117847759 [Setaria viridis]TKW28797.1 hypothetical protein SEVIR_3G351500v2 [Setaria viridis]